MNKDKLLSICNIFSGRCPRSLGLCDYISLTLNSLTLDYERIQTYWNGNG